LRAIALDRLQEAEHNSGVFGFFAARWHTPPHPGAALLVHTVNVKRNVQALNTAKYMTHNVFLFVRHK
jgi:hypothetical protein